MSTPRFLRELCIRAGWVLPSPGDKEEEAWAREGKPEPNRDRNVRANNAIVKAT